MAPHLFVFSLQSHIAHAGWPRAPVRTVSLGRRLSSSGRSDWCSFFLRFSMRRHSHAFLIWPRTRLSDLTHPPYCGSWYHLRCCICISPPIRHLRFFSWLKGRRYTPFRRIRVFPHSFEPRGESRNCIIARSDYRQDPQHLGRQTRNYNSFSASRHQTPPI